jgi:hypothetical protein
MVCRTVEGGALMRIDVSITRSLDQAGSAISLDVGGSCVETLNALLSCSHGQSS